MSEVLHTVICFPVEITGDIVEILTRIGATNIAKTSDGCVLARWSKFHVNAVLDDQLDFQRLILEYSQNRFWEVARDDSDELKITLTRSCQALDADAGWMVVHLGQTEPEYLDELDWYVQDKNGGALLERRLGLTYLGNSMIDARIGERHVHDRDGDVRLPDGGLVLFASRGDLRWI